MRTNLNFETFGNEPTSDGCGAVRPSENFSLVRQSSVYSLTIGEFQNSLGKEFGSMNMDELLKNFWTAEESQNMVSTGAANGGGGYQVGGNQSGNLQRQGSLTLPRTLNQKTVDEVWRNLSNSGIDANILQGTQRQPTLGQITLEEFLVRAGVVSEDAQIAEKPNNNNSGFGNDFQQPRRGIGLMGSHLVHNDGQISFQSPNLPVNANGARSSQQQTIAAQMPQQQPQEKQQQQMNQQQIFPKQSAVSYAPNLALPNCGIVGLANSARNGNLAQGSPSQNGGTGIVGAMSVSAGSPASLSFDGVGKSNGDTPSISPIPYMFNGAVRGRKANGVEKVIERRQRRLIKNRESAARSRQRKQVFTMELEQEVQELKEENEELKRKQENIMEMQKTEALEKLKSKKCCLRRAMTGPW